MTILKKCLKFGFSQLVKVSPVQASKLLYYKAFRKKLDLNNVQTFNEKLMWVKLNEDHALKTLCSDKYLVKDYVKQLGYSDILIQALKVYEHVEEIDFQQLPNKFVMKCTHGSGYNIICLNKDELIIDETISKLKKWMATDYGLQCCEPHYSKIKPRIIVEPFLEEALSDRVPSDYMIHCFHGVPQVIEVGVDCGERGKKYATFTSEWDALPYFEESMAMSEVVKKPEQFEKMLEIARSLSEAFTYVRVDLYYCKNKIYFGELTFTPAACIDQDFINDADLQMGKLLNLAAIKRKNTAQLPIQSHYKLKIMDIMSKIWPMFVFVM